MNLSRMRNSNLLCYYVLCISLFCTSFNEAAGFLDSIRGSIYNRLQSVGDFYCDKVTCCEYHLNDRDDALNLLRSKVESGLYGQHIAGDLILEAVKGHIKAPVKALTIGMHGWTGTGKNYVTRMIADSIYKKGFLSPIVNVFSGRASFPVDGDIDSYKRDIVNWIKGNVTKCRHSMFIFDECDKMPSGLLDNVVPFLDHHAVIGGVEYRNVIFIFLANTGGYVIKDRVFQLYEQGKTRDKLELMDFHHNITMNLFNEPGGFYHSDGIRGDAIDYYVPFMPLEEKHVISCIIDEFRRRGYVDVTKEMILEVLENMQFGPEDHPLFSVTGCKRVQALVINYTASHRKKVTKEEL